MRAGKSLFQWGVTVTVARPHKRTQRVTHESKAVYHILWRVSVGSSRAWALHSIMPGMPILAAGNDGGVAFFAKIVLLLIPLQERLRV
jgi:hypothetical protein